MTSFAQQLQKMHACHQAVTWVGRRTLEQAWRECERSDWMLWLLHKLRIDTRRCAGLFALRVWHLVPANSQLAAAWAIDCALRGADDAASAAASDAAWGAASTAASAAAWAAARDAAWGAAWGAARDAERRAQCDIIRDEIPLSVVRTALDRSMGRA